jgi:hypothetical protein
MDQSTAQRLAFTRYVFLLGFEQSYLPEPAGAVAILHFHDSVELFLQLASERFNVGKPRTQFMEYWDLIDPELGADRLAQRESMRRLNDARVSLKHHGTLPSALAIEQFRASVSSFFSENTPLVFGVHFERISMADLVRIDATRESLKRAEVFLEGGDLENAMVHVATAFAELIDQTNDAYRGHYGRSPFAFGHSFTFDRSFFNRGTVFNVERDRVIDKLIEAVEAIQEPLRIMAMGIDYARYVRFRHLAPSAMRTMAGTYHVQIVQGLRGSPPCPPTLESCRYCLGFVVECALKLDSFDPTLGQLPAGAE